MAQRENPDIAALIAGALDWWRDAGVDCAFVDDPVSWNATSERADQTVPTGLAPAPPAPVRKAAERPAVPATPALDIAALPDHLDAFRQWWMTEPTLADAPVGARVPPHGPKNAKLMVIVPEPERDDKEKLLSGPQGKLLDGMLNAFGIGPDETYIASAIPRHLPGADWQDMAKRGLGNVLLHHMKIAAPERVAVFGGNVLSLIGNAPPQVPADLRIFEHEGQRLPMLASRDLAAMLEQTRWKARVWQAWLDWTR